MNPLVPSSNELYQSLKTTSSIGIGGGGGALWTLFYFSLKGSQPYVSPCQLGHHPWVQDTCTLLTKI